MNEEKKHNIPQETTKKSAESAFSEFSRETGIRIELLRRFINKQTRQMKNETWGKLYPSIKELLKEKEGSTADFRRVGPPYRRHAELVEMVSDQKVLLDVFNIFPTSTQSQIAAGWSAKAKSTPAGYSSLNADENKIMGAYLAMVPEEREKELLQLVAQGREFIKSQR